MSVYHQEHDRPILEDQYKNTNEIYRYCDKHFEIYKRYGLKLISKEFIN